jgi:chemotaxis regulatin CheY-phosphate phosphatase CheZ
MKQNRLTFESKNLVVDWVSFKFQSLEDNDQRKIVHYLSKLGFDSYQESGKLANPIKESILVSLLLKFLLI